MFACTSFEAASPPPSPPPLVNADAGLADGAPSPAAPCVDRALSFDGSQYFDIEDAPGFDEPEPRTFEAWLKPRGGGARYIASHFQHQVSGWFFGLVGPAQVGLRVYEGPSFSTVSSVGTGEIREGQWVHVAAVWGLEATGTVARLFADGKLVGERTDFRRTSTDHRGPVRIGASTDDPLPIAGFVGEIAEIRISTDTKYRTEFERPRGPLPIEADTVALVRVDEDTVRDATGKNVVRLPLALATQPRPVSAPCIAER